MEVYLVKRSSQGKGKKGKEDTGCKNFDHCLILDLPDAD